MKKTAKRIFALLAVFIFAVGVLAGCSGSSDYDKGYTDGFHVKEKGMFYSFTSQDYKSGYEQGWYDANIITIYENCDKDLNEAASYLGLSVYNLKEQLKGLGYRFD